MTKRLFLILFASLFSLSLFATHAFCLDTQIVAGAGPSTKICKLFFTEFNQLDGVQGYKFLVMDGSVKHKGGILNSDKYLFGRTGRPLTAEEIALGKEQIFLAKVPIAFVKGLEVNVPPLSMDDIQKIFTREITNWSDLGGPDATILLVGREQTEALFMSLKEEYPVFKNVTFDKKFKKDDGVIQFLSSPLGKHAIAFGAKPNFSKYNLLEVEGFASGVSVGLVYDVKNKDNPMIKLAEEYAASSDWTNEVDKTPMLIIK